MGVVVTPRRDDDAMEYRRNERHLYKPPPCPDCGSTNVAVSWIENADLSTPPGQETYLPGSLKCRDCRNLQR